MTPPIPPHRPARGAYATPALRPLGTLGELTLGGSVNGPSDGHGFAGDQGSIAPSVVVKGRRVLG